MHHETSSRKPVNSNAELQRESEVCFDPDKTILEGLYTDELSAHRARKNWLTALETHFLLDLDHDFSMKIEFDEADKVYRLKCTFSSACARYAFWRLTNSQAPEAQYIIETAHIPSADSQTSRFLTAPDLKSVKEDSFLLGSYGKIPGVNINWVKKVKALIDSIGKLPNK